MTEIPSPPRVIVIGAGSRGRAYARAITSATTGVIAAVAEPDTHKRSQFRRNFIRGDTSPSEVADGVEFASWQEFIDHEKQRRQRVAAGDQDVLVGVDAALVCVLDDMHCSVVVALSQLGGLHIMCEKPLATSLQECIDMYSALRANRHTTGAPMLFAVGHVLRYSPHNMLLRELLLNQRVIGDVLSVVHTEPIGWWHFTHSYVRGNWRREGTSAPSLLTKSCHDIDLLLWLLCSPPFLHDDDMSHCGPPPPPHMPSTVTSTGSLQYFKRSRKPPGAGRATNCLSCPIEESCKYSAKRIYLGDTLAGLGTGNTNWPISIVMPDIEDFDNVDSTSNELRARLAQDYDERTPDSEISRRNWFGRCVYEADNDVCDDQVVTMTWDEDEASLVDSSPQRRDGKGAKMAIFHMVAHTRKICERYTHIYGVDGEIYADSTAITVEDFATGTTTTHRPALEQSGHGGGDQGIMRQFISAVDKVKNHGQHPERAQREFIGCTLLDVLMSHAMVLCADEARREKRVVNWNDWWTGRVKSVIDGDDT